MRISTQIYQLGIWNQVKPLLRRIRGQRRTWTKGILQIPELGKEDSTKSAEASKPTATSEVNISVTKLEESLQSLGDDYVLKELGLKYMLTKKDFKDCSHLKSGRYFLPKIPLLTEEGNKSGLLIKLTVIIRYFS